MATLNPTAIKRWIALELRRLREAAGLDRAAAADRIGKASTVIAHIETTRNLPAPADLEVLLALYGVPEQAQHFRDMVRRAKRGKDWWIKYTDTAPEYLNLYLGLETGAARINSVDLIVLQGLFQTRDYATAILGPPGRQVSNDDLTALVDLRMERQKVLDRETDALRIWSVLDEGVLHRQVGGPAVMREQLNHLIELSERPNIDIQVLPFTSGAHSATDGTFMILDFPPEFVGDPGTAYVENRRQGFYYDSAEALRDFRNVFERLQVQAEKPERSREIIRNLVKEYS